MTKCLFCEIVNRNIPTNAIYEDDDIIMFYDINPKAKIHFLTIPKQHITSLLNVDAAHEKLLGYMLIKASEVAKDLGLENGFKTVINSGINGGQEVFHLHIHTLGN